MAHVMVRNDESFERALKRFKRKCEKEGILSEIRKRAYYDKPSIRKRKKVLAARKRAMKKKKGRK
jgi:small subunit ribosomal protein S21